MEPVTVVIGLLLLVLDSSNPLNFYRLLFHWNLRSVMYRHAAVGDLHPDFHPVRPGRVPE